jgi:hypothetical protein
MDHAPASRVRVEEIGDAVFARKNLTGTITCTRRSSDGLPYSKTMYPFKSFVSNFSHILNYGFCNIANASLIKDLDGSNLGGSSHSGTLKSSTVTNGEAGDEDETFYGVMIGCLGTAPGSLNLSTVSTSSQRIVNSTDYALHQMITYDHIDATATQVSLDEGDTKLTIRRTFTNQSGSSVDIREIGLGIKDGSGNFIMISRDINSLATPINETLPNTHLLEVEYTFALQKTVGYGFNTNFMTFLYSNFTNTEASFTSTTGVAEPVNMYTNRTDKKIIDATTNDHDWGIQIGNSAASTAPPNLGGLEGTTTGATASSMWNTYKLVNPYTSSFSFSAVTAQPYAVATTNTKTIMMFGVYRDFSNAGQGSLKANEFGIVLNTSGDKNIMIYKDDMINSAKNVLGGKILRIYFEFEFDVWDSAFRSGTSGGER